MLSFFKKNSTEEEIIEEIEDILPEQDLFIHPSWVNLPQEMRYVYQYEHFELPIIEKDSFGIHGVSMSDSKGKYNVLTFIRNTTDKAYCLENVIVYLVNDNKETAATMRVNLKKDTGNIPSNSNMPWIFIFDESTRTELELSKDNWNIVFKVPDPHKLEIDQDMFTDEEKKQIEDAYKKLAPIEEDNLNFSGITCEIDEEYNVSVMTFIRNGYFRDASLSELTLEVIDANNSKVCRTQFTFDNLVIPANSTIPWKVHFRSLFIMNTNPDLSNWRIQVSENK